LVCGLTPAPTDTEIERAVGAEIDGRGVDIQVGQEPAVAFGLPDDHALKATTIKGKAIKPMYKVAVRGLTRETTGDEVANALYGAGFHAVGVEFHDTPSAPATQWAIAWTTASAQTVNAAHPKLGGKVLNVDDAPHT
jgi:hypothetical protein